MAVCVENQTYCQAYNTDPIYQTIFALSVSSTVINLLLSLPLNSYVLWLINTEPNASRVSSEFFAMHLAISDILCCIGSPLLPLIMRPTGYTILQAFGFFASSVTTARPLFQTCICVERYLAVLHPVLFLKLRAMRFKVACSAVAWLVVLASGLLTTFRPLLLLALWCAVSFTFFLVMSFCCLAVLRALTKPGPGDRGSEREQSSQIKRRAFKIILVILVVMVVSHIPLVALLALQHRLQREQLAVGSSIHFNITLLLSFIQPILYLQRSGKLSFMSPH